MPSWNVQAYGFVARYHADIDFKRGAGTGLTIGHAILKNWLSCDAGLEYTRAAQTLMLIDGAHDAHVDISQSFFALRGQWPIKKRFASVVASLLAGCSFFRPQALTIDAGTLGQVTLHPKGETKLVAASSAGLKFRIAGEASVFFSIKQNFSRFAQRRLDAARTQIKWRPYWNYGVGLSWSF